MDSRGVADVRGRRLALSQVAVRTLEAAFTEWSSAHVAASLLQKAQASFIIT